MYSLAFFTNSQSIITLRVSWQGDWHADMQFKMFRLGVGFSADRERKVAGQNELSPIRTRVGRTDTHDRQRIIYHGGCSVLIYWIGTLWRGSLDRSRAKIGRGVFDWFAWRPLFFAARASERFIIRAADAH